MKVLVDIKDELVRDFMRATDMSLEAYIAICLSEYQPPEAIQTRSRRVDPADSNLLVETILDRIRNLEPGTVFTIRDVMTEDEVISVRSMRSFGRQLAEVLKTRTTLVSIVSGPPMKYKRW